MKKNILILGAGRSAGSLIRYLVKKAKDHGWGLTVADCNSEVLKRYQNSMLDLQVALLDINNREERRSLIAGAAVTISLMPPFLHEVIARDCLDLHSHLLTASYLNKTIAEMNDQAMEKGLLFLVEMGLDPGIDHMSAMQVIHRIRKDGGKIESFKSYTGGLVCKSPNDNPWHYKITWNPANVVSAGRGTARYLLDGKIVFLPYAYLFQSAQPISVPDSGEYEMYPNRDSLLYIPIYGLQETKTLIRGTLRHPGFCHSWAIIVALGLTDDQLIIENGSFNSFREILLAFLPPGSPSLAEGIRSRAPWAEQKSIDNVLWLFDDTVLPTGTHRMIDLLQYLIESKWILHKTDRDLVVMTHELIYERNGNRYLVGSGFRKEGVDSENTAMADLVGLPLGIATCLLLEEHIQSRGVMLPTVAEIYQPVLNQLRKFGVVFQESELLI